MSTDTLNDATQRALFEVLSRNGRDPAALISLLGRAGLTTDQMNMIEMLFTLDQQQDTEPPRARPRRRLARRTPRERTRERVLRELADLREVNDTLAAALGACRVCWGGDGTCTTCQGRGGSGSRLPDPELFKRLVAPAVRRLGALTRARSAEAVGIGAESPDIMEVTA